MANRYEQVTVIPDNREFYQGFDLGEMHNGWRLKIRPNVILHYNNTLRIDDTELTLSPRFLRQDSAEVLIKLELLKVNQTMYKIRGLILHN